MKYKVKDYNSNADNDILGQFQIQIDDPNLEGIDLCKAIIKRLDEHYKVKNSEIINWHEEHAGSDHIEPNHTFYITGRDTNGAIFTSIVQENDDPIETRLEIAKKFVIIDQMLN